VSLCLCTMIGIRKMRGVSHPMYPLHELCRLWQSFGPWRSLKVLSCPSHYLWICCLFDSPELSNDSNTVMAFYATSLASAVGPSYQTPSLVFLARRWFDASSESRYDQFSYSVHACLKMKYVRPLESCSTLSLLTCLMKQVITWLSDGSITVSG
jgi:hypothetical protein